MPSNAYDLQLASIPGTVRGVLDAEIDIELDPRRPLIFTGIGTSLHAARVASDWVALLSKGEKRAFAIDAHDIGAGATPISKNDQLVCISHRGKKIFPTAAQAAAKRAGASPIIAVVGEAAPPQSSADVTIRTCKNETAGTFSVSYLASLVVLAKIVAAYLPNESKEFLASLNGLPAALTRSLELKPGMNHVQALSRAQPIIISGFGQDTVTAQEAALKIKEGAWLWTEAMSPEFALHGTPASYRPEMSAIIIMPARDDGGRSKLLKQVLLDLNLAHVATCDLETNGADLQFAEPPHPLLRPFVSIIPFHLLTAALAHVRQTDPETLHGHREPWKKTMTGLQL